MRFGVFTQCGVFVRECVDACRSLCCGCSVDNWCCVFVDWSCMMVLVSVRLRICWCGYLLEAR